MIYNHHGMMFSKIEAIASNVDGDLTNVESNSDKIFKPASLSSTTTSTVLIDSILLTSSAWYREGTVDLKTDKWPDAGGGSTVTLSGSGITELRKKRHGGVGEVVSLQSITSSKINFWPVIKENNYNLFRHGIFWRYHRTYSEG
jgi:hypothetical protein